MNLNKNTIIYGAGAVIVLYLFFKSEAAKAAAAVGEAVNPVSDKNIFYSGVNSIGAKLSGNSKFDLGKSIYNLFHPNAPTNKTDTPSAQLPQPVIPSKNSSTINTSGPL